MYFEKHVCNSRTTEPERSLWRPATSKSPQRCKVASPPPPAHCPRSTSRVVRIVRLQRHCCEVAISRECRRHSKCIQREAVVDGPLPPSTSTQQRPLAHDAEASRRDSASAEGTVASRGAASAETASRRAPCATAHDGRLARRRPLQNQRNGTHPSAPRVDAHERHNENPRGARVDARIALVRQGCDELARHKAIDMCVTCKISVFLP